MKNLCTPSSSLVSPTNDCALKKAVLKFVMTTGSEGTPRVSHASHYSLRLTWFTVPHAEWFSRQENHRTNAVFIFSFTDCAPSEIRLKNLNYQYLQLEHQPYPKAVDVHYHWNVRAWVNCSSVVSKTDPKDASLRIRLDDKSAMPAATNNESFEICQYLMPPFGPTNLADSCKIHRISVERILKQLRWIKNMLPGIYMRRHFE